MEEELDNVTRPPHPSELPAPEDNHTGLAVADRTQSLSSSPAGDSLELPGRARAARASLPLPSGYDGVYEGGQTGSKGKEPSKSQPQPNALSSASSASSAQNYIQSSSCPAPGNDKHRSQSKESQGDPLLSDISSEHSRLIEDASTLFGDDEHRNAGVNVGEEDDSHTAIYSSSNASKSKVGGDQRRSTYGVSRMQKFSLYETAARFYLVGMDLKERRFRVLKIERTSESEELMISDDDTTYSKKEINQLLDAVHDGNKISGGLKLRCCTWGLLGFIRFTGTYYMLLITKRSQVAMLGGHFVYQIDGTELIPLSPSVSGKTRTEKVADEARFLAIINNLDLTRSFYFSYSYDITRTLQFNITKAREAVQRGHPGTTPFSNVNSMFEWNHYLLQPVVPSLKNPYDWCFPIVHGYVDQANISVFGRPVYVTVIARRSRYFAGARFLKRGANDLGYVANDVETEQIVSDTLTTSFHAPGPRLYANPRYTSYVQHRGSIPLYWSQDSTGVAPKPDIEMNLVDPFYSAAALHFDNLFERYGAPVYVLNLVKAREREPRESKLLREYTDAIMYLNQFLPEDKCIVYKAFDMSRAAKSRDQDVILSLEEIAEDIIPRTGLFKAGEGEGVDRDGDAMLQNGVARTNCIDCLDRTNAAQFVIGKRALGHQLHALGIIDTTSIEYDTDAINMFTNMWHHHGDTIAVQYGGSQLVNTMATYRKTNQWTGQSRDMVESFKRYYNNSFLDAQRQEAYNLFLGNYVYTPHEPMLWDLSTDYYLHHSNPKQFLCFKRRSYINWYTPEFLEKRTMPGAVTPLERKIKRKEPAHRGNAISDPKSKRGQLEDDGDIIGQYDDYFTEYYRPLGLSLFQKTYAFKMKSTARYLPYGHGAVAASPARNAASSGRSSASGHAHTNTSSSHHAMYDMSPFTPRVASPIHEAYGKKHSRRKGVTIKDPRDVRHGDTTRTSSPAASAATNTADDARSVSSSMSEFSTTHKPLQQWLQTIPSSSARDDRRSPNGLKGIIKPRLPGQHSSPLVSFAPDTYAPTSTSTTPRLPPPDHYHDHDHDHDADYDADPSATTTTTATATATATTTTTPPRSSSRTLEDVVNQTLHPTVSKAEADEYNRYVNHPLTMPLVGSISDTEDRVRSVATETRSAAQRELDSRADADLLEYADKRLVDELIMDITAEYNLVTYSEYVRVQPEEGLAVLKNDHLQKRYRLYESWTKGRSVLKQRVDG